MFSGDGSSGGGSDRRVETSLTVGVWGWMEGERLEAREYSIRNRRNEVGEMGRGLSQSWRQAQGSDGYLGNRIRVREGQMLKNEP